MRAKDAVKPRKFVRAAFDLKSAMTMRAATSFAIRWVIVCLPRLEARPVIACHDKLETRGVAACLNFFEILVCRACLNVFEPQRNSARR